MSSVDRFDQSFQKRAYRLSIAWWCCFPFESVLWIVRRRIDIYFWFPREERIHVAVLFIDHSLSLLEGSLVVCGSWTEWIVCHREFVRCYRSSRWTSLLRDRNHFWPCHHWRVADAWSLWRSLRSWSNVEWCRARVISPFSQRKQISNEIVSTRTTADQRQFSSFSFLLLVLNIVRDYRSTESNVSPTDWCVRWGSSAEAMFDYRNGYWGLSDCCPTRESIDEWLPFLIRFSREDRRRRRTSQHQWEETFVL